VVCLYQAIEDSKEQRPQIQKAKEVPAGPKKGHAGQKPDLKRNN
jgi:hypothetical protein